MNKYGIDNVRGGSYTTIKLSNDIINFLEIEISHINNKSKKYDNPLELISFDKLSSYSPYEIVKIFPILDKLQELKTYRIKIGDVILNDHIDKYNTLDEIIKDASKIYVNSYIQEHKNKYYFVIPYIPTARIKFFKDFAILLASLPCEIIKEMIENKKNI
jgi:hypothetical protein